MSINILYIGNKLATKGKTATTIDVLGPLWEQEGIALRYASTIDNVLLRLLDMMRATFLSRNWAHFVLIDTYSTRNYWYAIIIARLCHLFKVKYIPILHGGNLPERLYKNPKSMKAFIENAHTVVSPSDYLIHAYAKAGFKQLIKIPNHIHLDQYPFKARKNIQPNLLWVRSFAAIYNPKMALEVLELVAARYPQARLCMVGPDKDGSLKKCAAIASQKQLQVEFTGLLSKADWISLSSRYDLFINSSQFDNLPVSLIEAMALGLPVVSTNVGGIPYLIQHNNNGLLVNPNDAQQMAAQIISLLEDQQQVDRLTKSALMTAQQLDWEIVKPLWMQLFKGKG